MAQTATGVIASAGAEPEERTSTCPSDRAVRKPAAIWERPALWTQTNMTVGRSDMGSPSVNGAIRGHQVRWRFDGLAELLGGGLRSEEHTSELQSRGHLVCRLLL